MLVPFTTTGTFQAGNSFRVELSDSTGSFATPTVLIPLNQTSPLQVVLPNSSAYGIGYRVRVFGTAPNVTGTGNGTDLTIFARPVAGTVSSTQVICTGADVVLRLNGAIGTIQWQISVDSVNFVDVSGANTDTLFVSSVTSRVYYRVSISNGVCTPAYSNVVRIGVVPPPLAGFIHGEGTICFNTGGTWTLTMYSGTIQWQSSTDGTTFNDIPGETDSILTLNNLTTTTYIRSLVTRTGCVTDTTGILTISVLPEVQANFTASKDTVIMPNAEIQFTNTSAPAGNSNWHFGDRIYSNIANPTHRYNAQGTYQVELIYVTAQGCADTVVKTIVVLPEQPDFFIPNTFTPNGDGRNDQFAPIYGNTYTGYVMQVYDRWGQLVVERNNNSWDGADNPEGVYVYVIKAKTTSGGEETFYGTVTLIR